MFGPLVGQLRCLQCGKTAEISGVMPANGRFAVTCQKADCPGANRWAVPNLSAPPSSGPDKPATPKPLDAKPTNPKDAAAVDRVPLHLVSPIAKAYQAIAQFLGMVKYGAWNWRNSGARASIYKSALERHMDAWFSGEEFDPIDGTPHLANAMACLQILIEAKETGNLVDDRPIPVDIRPTYRMVEELMPKIRERYADRTPEHFTRDQQC